LCKKGYHGLGSDDENGCSACACSINGTLNELDNCNSESGKCECKLFVESKNCDECKPGFYGLKRSEVGGCKSCDCLSGASKNNECDSKTGQCSCLSNLIGEKCDQVKNGFYIKDLHNTKYEMEDGISDDLHVNYLFNEKIFTNYSWKGYVHLNKYMGEVHHHVAIDKLGTYKMIMRFINTNLNIAKLKITVFEAQNESGKQIVSMVDFLNLKLVLEINLFLIIKYLFTNFKDLRPTVEPSFATVTINQMNDLVLDLEPSDYLFIFETSHENIYIVR
jgi:hypothetical protein